MKYMSSGWREISKSPISVPKGAPPKVPNSSSYTFLKSALWSKSCAVLKSRTSSCLVALKTWIFIAEPVLVCLHR